MMIVLRMKTTTTPIRYIVDNHNDNNRIRITAPLPDDLFATVFRTIIARRVANWAFVRSSKKFNVNKKERWIIGEACKGGSVLICTKVAIMIRCDKFCHFYFLYFS